MLILFSGLVFFALGFFVHLIIWKVRLPKTNHSRLLLYIFSGVFILGIFATKITSPQDFLELLILYYSLVLAYITTYSAIEVDSPSLAIVLLIDNTGSAGLSQEMLYNYLNDEKLVIPRINDLLRDKMIQVEKGNYRLTPKGSYLASIFVILRRVLNSPMGG